MKSFFSEKSIVFLVLSLMLSVSSCNIKDKDFETMERGVVLVIKCSYYEMKLPEGLSIFFKDYTDEEGIVGLTFDEDSVDVKISSGTGFFISADGLIATNAHVVSSKVDEREVTRAMGNIMASVKKELLGEFDKYSDAYEKLNQMVKILEEAGNTSSLSYNEYVEERNFCAQQLLKLKNICEIIDGLRVSEGELEYHSILRVAFSDTYVEGIEDCCGCVLKDCDVEHDVAIIQLKDKTTPNGRFVFYVPEKNPLETYSFGEKIVDAFGKGKNERLMLMGYNAGPALAFTNDGIKCQRTSGEISQTETDRIMYTIPTIAGSSGSPVVNLRGELVAVNYAGIQGTQNFNYGVLVKYLRKLMDKDN